MLAIDSKFSCVHADASLYKLSAKQEASRINCVRSLRDHETIICQGIGIVNNTILIVNNGGELYTVVQFEAPVRR